MIRRRPTLTTWSRASRSQPGQANRMSSLSSLPSVERLLQTEDVSRLVRKHGRPLTLDAIRMTLDEMRSEIKGAPDSAPPELSKILKRTEDQLSRWERPGIQTVINATGVILHTNLGRAPLPESAIRAMAEASRGYSNIELDLESGKRGSRA